MQTKKYTVPYVVSLIRNKYKISESRFYKADLSASDLLMDLEIILERIHLTDKQEFIARSGKEIKHNTADGREAVQIYKKENTHCIKRDGRVTL